MFDSSNPENYVNGSEGISPEFAAVCSTDDGLGCGSENDGIMALLKEMGF